MTHAFLKIPIKPLSLSNIREQVQKYIRTPYAFFHIVSLNPEIMVIAHVDEEFRNILSQGDIQITDGIGMVLGGAFLGIPVGERVTGVDLMEIILQDTHKEGLRILLLGGKPNLAERLANCYQEKYPHHMFKGIEGIHDIRHPQHNEQEQIFSIVADYKPQIVFVSFGSPYQEKWISRHKERLPGIVCMGVGGGFDFAAGEIKRAPKWVQTLGLEWLYRLFREPWRWKRQLRLITFVYLVVLQRIGIYR